MAHAPRHTSRGIVVHNGQLLLMERWRDGLHYFSIPGGGIEPGETAEQTVVREILEETGVAVLAEHLVIEMHHHGTRHHIFVCRYVSGEPELSPNAPEALLNDPNNRFNPGWVPLDNVAHLSLGYWEPIRQTLLQGLAQGFPPQVQIVSPT